MKFTFGKTSTRGLGIFKAKELPEGTIVRRTDGWYQKSGGEWKRLPHEHAALKQGPHVVPEIDPAKVLDDHLNAMEIDGWDETSDEDKNDIKEDILEDIHSLFHTGDNKKFWKEWAKTHGGKPDAMHKEVVEAVAARMRETAKPPVLAQPKAPAPVVPASRGIKEPEKVTPPAPASIPPQILKQANDNIRKENPTYIVPINKVKKEVEKLVGRKVSDEELFGLITTAREHYDIAQEVPSGNSGALKTDKGHIGFIRVYPKGEAASQNPKQHVAQHVTPQAIPHAVTEAKKEIFKPAPAPVQDDVESKRWEAKRLLQQTVGQMYNRSAVEDPIWGTVADGLNWVMKNGTDQARNFLIDLFVKNPKDFIPLIGTYVQIAKLPGQKASVFGVRDFIQKQAESQSGQKVVKPAPAPVVDDNLAKIDKDYTVHPGNFKEVLGSKNFYNVIGKFYDRHGISAFSTDTGKGDYEILTREGGVVLGVAKHGKAGTVRSSDGRYFVNPKLLSDLPAPAPVEPPKEEKPQWSPGHNKEKIKDAIQQLTSSTDNALREIGAGLAYAAFKAPPFVNSYVNHIANDVKMFQSVVNEYFQQAGMGATSGGFADFMKKKAEQALQAVDDEIQKKQAPKPAPKPEPKVDLKPLDAEGLAFDNFWGKNKAALDKVVNDTIAMGVDPKRISFEDEPHRLRYVSRGKTKYVETKIKRMYVDEVLIGIERVNPPVKGVAQHQMLSHKEIMEAVKFLARTGKDITPKPKAAPAPAPAPKTPSVDDAHPGAAIGEIHEWKDGWYEKVGPGEWKQVNKPAERGIKDDTPTLKAPKESKKAPKGKGAVSPSVNMTLAQLKSIKENNYIGASGQEYVAEEVDTRINEITPKKGEQLYEKQMKSEADQHEVHLEEIRNKLLLNDFKAVSHDQFWDGIVKFENETGLKLTHLHTKGEVQVSVDGKPAMSSRLGTVSTDDDGTSTGYTLNMAYFDKTKSPLPGTVGKPLPQKEKEPLLDVVIPKGFKYLGEAGPDQHLIQHEKTGDVMIGEGVNEADWKFHASKKNLAKENAKVNEVIEKLDKEAGKEPLIVGKTWEEIQAMQQKTYKPKLVDTSVSGKKEATKEDIALLKKHGEAGLKEKEFYGTLERLETSGLLKKEEPTPAPDPEPTVKEMTPKTIAQAITTENTAQSIIPIEVDSLPDVDLTLLPKLDGRMPSKYQMAVFKFIKFGKGNGIVDAVAGSGKSTTIEIAFDLLSAGDKLNTRFLAFNKHIERELGTRGLPAKTMHAEGFAAWRNAMKGARVAVENNKILNILNEDLPGWGNKEMRLVVSDLVNKAKLHGLVPKAALKDNPKLQSLMEDDDQNWTDLMQRFDIQAPAGETMGSVIRLARSALTDSIQQKDVIDFSDMIYMPMVYNTEMPKYKFLFVDELQDLNPLQHVLVSKMLAKDGRFIGVGDPFQSMYGFAGADVHGMKHAQDVFKATKLPLSICYRCPKEIIEKMAKPLVPHIEAAPWAPKGEIEHHGLKFDNKMFKMNDMILCRTNAPLVQLTYQLIKDRIPCKMLGRDIGAGLAKIIKKQKAGSVPELINKLEAWVAKEVNIAQRKNPDADVSFIQDKFDTIMTFVDNAKATTPEGIAAEIEDLFADEDTKGVVRLSSVHKAKGLEADNVFILNDHLMPGKWAKTPDDLQQERNIQYVAYTRPKKKLGFIEMEKRSSQDITKSVMTIFRASSRGLSDDVGITKSRITIPSILNIGRRYASR
jgi:hypothetical protein